MYTSYEQMPIYLTVPEYAKAMQVGLNTAYNMVRSGKITSIRVGTQYRIPKEALLLLVQDTKFS